MNMYIYIYIYIDIYIERESQCKGLMPHPRIYDMAPPIYDTGSPL